MADSATPNQLFDLWRKQFEEGAAAYARWVRGAADPDCRFTVDRLVPRPKRGEQASA